MPLRKREEVQDVLWSALALIPPGTLSIRRTVGGEPWIAAEVLPGDVDDSMA